MKSSPSGSGNASSKASGTKTRTFLRRLIYYSEKIFGLADQILARISDRRPAPRIPTAITLKATLAMFWARLGSLNALESVAPLRFWNQWLGQPLCSVDTIGRVQAQLNCDELCTGVHHVYGRLKRNKALPLNLGRNVAGLDRHEHHASNRRHCSGCWQCVVRGEHGERVQFYHRNVTLMLI